ncbi:MAG: serine hydrolase [Alphaproteobacteria bacterium]|nr:serine hydrolase [Alphaproteobacteria bacterium]
MIGRRIILAATAGLSLAACGAETPAARPQTTAGAPAAEETSPAARLMAAVEAENTLSMAVLKNGERVFAYGPIIEDEPTYTASVRKSILAMVMGEWVENGTIDLDATLADMGVDDVEGLTDIEKTATYRDLIEARSGVYHPASNFSGVTEEEPKRGDHAPGTYYWYNNWDFNAAGAIFEKLTGKSLFAEFQRQFAEPMGLQPFDLARHEREREERTSESSYFPPYHFYLSTDDLARLGQLMLDGGVWEGERLISEAWVDEMTALATPAAEMNPERLRGGELGYGYMWWVFDPATARPEFEGGYAGRGHFGQYILVLPRLDIVIAHKTAPQRYEGPEEYDAVNVDWDEFMALVDLAIAAYGG